MGRMGSITMHGQLSLSGSRLLPSPGIKNRDRKPYDPGKYTGKIKQVEKSGFGETLTLHSE